MTPTQRTLELLKKQGLTCGIVERWIPFGPGDPRKKFSPGLRKDFLDIIDIIALDTKNIIGIQSTGADFSGHFKKLTKEKGAESLNWLNAPGTSLQLWAWRKVLRTPGGKQMIWKPRIREITVADILYP